jgi:hypothetical protein
MVCNPWREGVTEPWSRSALTSVVAASTVKHGLPLPNVVS